MARQLSNPVSLDVSSPGLRRTGPCQLSSGIEADRDRDAVVADIRWASEKNWAPDRGAIAESGWMLDQPMAEDGPWLQDGLWAMRQAAAQAPSSRRSSVPSFADPLPELNARDQLAIADYFESQDIDSTIQEVLGRLQLLSPEPCWEEQPYEFLRGHL